MKITATFGSRLVTKRKMSAQQFLKEKQSGKVTRARFVPPAVGSDSFGYFEADLDRPRHEVILE